MYSLESEAAPVPAPRGATSLIRRWVPVTLAGTVPGVMFTAFQAPVPKTKFSLVSLCPPMVHAWALASDVASTEPRAARASERHTRFTVRLLGRRWDGGDRRGEGVPVGVRASAGGMV